MTTEDWAIVIGSWVMCWVTGYVAGQAQRWFQALAEKL